MTDIISFAFTFMLFLVDIFTLFLIGGIFYIIGLAIHTMASNRTPRWDSIFYVLVILMMAIWLVRWYPTQIISSVRVSMQESRPEADLLRTEVQYWLPGLDQWQPTPTWEPAPAAAPVAPPAADKIPEEAVEVPQPQPTETAVSPTPIPTTTPTAVATFDPHTWNPATPPPTPERRQ
ncbi:MAG: hypothetical protein R6X32_05945 [Chloroflexota bacterium]